MTLLPRLKARLTVIGLSLVNVAVFLPWTGVAIAQAGSSAVASVPSIDQALEAQVPAGPALSPDGQRVVYEVSRTNWKSNAFERDLWIADRAGNTHLLTAQVKSSSSAQWSPDGKWIAFTSDRPGQVAE